MNTNAVYVFLPFVLKDYDAFHKLSKKVAQSASWTPVTVNHKYMFRFVAEKIRSADPEVRQCFSCRLKEEHRASLGILSPQTPYDIRPERDAQKRTFPFYLEDIQLHGFSTSVGIVVFRLRFENNDATHISTAEYYLKKVSKEILHTPDGQGNTTLLRMAQSLTEEFTDISPFDFFYFANQGQERANIFTYLQTECKEHYNEELFYLRRCYSDDYIYHENAKTAESEVFSLARGIYWGVTSEAAVCLTCPEKGEPDFIRGTFTTNIHEQYLYMYVLLLHQRYVLYMFLSKIGIGKQNNLKMLEQYKEHLYEFETNFVFSCVTEVPQYQTLYDRVSEAFELKRMYDDVYEPLTALSECKRQKQETTVNSVLFVLSLLTLVSVLTDVLGLVEGVSGLREADPTVAAWQVACMALILVGAPVMLAVLMIRNKK